MARLTTTLLMATALVATAACSKKRPEVLPPAPGAAPIAVIVNMTPVARMPYRVPMPHDGRWNEILNSDAHDYWGSGLGNLGGVVAAGGYADVTLPPLATVMLELEPAA